MVQRMVRMIHMIQKMVRMVQRMVRMIHMVQRMVRMVQRMVRMVHLLGITELSLHPCSVFSVDDEDSHALGQEFGRVADINSRFWSERGNIQHISHPLYTLSQALSHT